ncbi:ATP-dependent DNA helicase [Nocardioides baekrokdamisoli]|uniref:DNA 3'-5' helicase n=1 Tax=Nocardioides baekrokdamisoli TaxID=1804624 RepID=A0A3G9IZ45_9ACTN|nr:UvrD-helicase domain-containing protein [Nocardioides baekrokdamisoli]BBH16464.1 ATP-dependent DNA helicase [Nocardioides baekrokdamisoli]
MRIETPAQLAELMGESWMFSDEQFAAVTAPLEPVVVIAGAGSGKTSVMAGRVVWLVANGLVEPGQILGLTFTTKATGELQQRVRKALTKADLLTADSDEPTISTYHAYAGALLSEHGLRIGHEPDARLIADATRYQLAARAVSQHATHIALLSDHPQTVVKDLLSLDAELSEHLSTVSDARVADARERAMLMEEMAADTAKGDYLKALSAIDRRAELLGLVDGYRALKARLGLIDFSDQIALTAQLAEEAPEVGELQRATFRVVLLDEYQDTSIAQARMLRALFGGHAVMAVGDPNQAIYGWRGASVSNILGFAEDYPGARNLALATNRRSDVRILQTANHLAAPLESSGMVQALRPQDGAAPGEVDVWVHERWDDELEWLGREVVAAHATGVEWKEIGVLVRSNRHGAAVYDALLSAGAPVEIVGLKGLLRLPEVAEVLATLSLVQDVTDNASLLTLLTGARWSIGARDLALLSQRASELSPRRDAEPTSLRDQLARAAEDADPLETPALLDALEAPGLAAYSDGAQERFGELASELRRLRAAAGEPVLDLVRRIIDVTGVDVELASAVSESARARRDNVDLFVQAVADFQAYDGAVTLPALMAWLEAEDEFEQGLDVAVPSEADSVKLLTVHRAKGLEWDVVFVPGVTTDHFPITRARSSHLSAPAVLPLSLRGDKRDLPPLRGLHRKQIAEWNDARRAHAADEELRLAYVAWTRARHRVVLSAWRWAPHRDKGLGPSAYLERTREAMAMWGQIPSQWAEAVDNDIETNPYDGQLIDLPWPISHDTAEATLRRRAAELVREAVDDGYSDAVVESWDRDLERLLAERETPEVIDVAVTSMSATALATWQRSPESYLASVVRPMPRQPNPRARFGTRFHAWVEQRFGQTDLFGPDELPGRADVGIGSEEDLAELIEAFEAGPFADRAPEAVEQPFALPLGGHVVRGRIDAVYRDGDGYLVVDWKTGEQPADPLQLAVYRIAWAELAGCPVEDVRAAFVHVRSGRIVEPSDLPDRAALAASFEPAVES